MRPLSPAVPALRLGALDGRDRGARGPPPGGRAALRRQHGSPTRRRRRGRRRSPPRSSASSRTATAASPSSLRRDRGLQRRRAGERRPRRRGRRPADALRAVVRRAGRRGSRSRTSRPTRSTASPPGSPAPTSATTTRCSPSSAARTTRAVRWSTSPPARPLVVDEAYFEYGGETAVPLLGDDVIVVRTFSKAFRLASARVGYALATVETANALNERQQPAPISTLAAALALAGLEAGPPDVSATIAERERLAAGLRGVGLEPLPSRTNFVLVPHARAQELYEALLARGARRPALTGGDPHHRAPARRRRPARRPRSPSSPERVVSTSRPAPVSPWRTATRATPGETCSDVPTRTPGGSVSLSGRRSLDWSSAGQRQYSSLPATSRPPCSRASSGRAGPRACPACTPRRRRSVDRRLSSRRRPCTSR